MEQIKFYGQYKNETTRAVLVNDGVEDIWLPRSQVKHMRQIRDSDYEFTIPHWLAKKKSII
ncbi:MAG: hypothetical protein K9J79_03690 [Desulfobacteraceae bacterium]|nr:hypothetical protein [Desulfobacteraceae bacterium]